MVLAVVCAALLPSACVVTPALQKTMAVEPVIAPPPSRPAAITVEADAALKAAEQSVIEARQRRNLWTAAVEHLEQARQAARLLDSEGTLKHAREVVALCALSAQQGSAPLVNWQRQE
jgi:hypothetical protein